MEIADCLSVFLSKRKGAHESNKWRKKENIQKKLNLRMTKISYRNISNHNYNLS